MKLEEIYMHTASGTKVFPFAMKPEQVDIETIARHLACQSRWLGATQHRFLKDRISYSVAEHSVYVADYVAKELARPDLAFDALMHDAAEAYTGDMIRPLKYSPAFKNVFKELEEKVELVIAKKFDLQYPFAPEIKFADDVICMTEWEQIVPRDPGEQWGQGVVKPGEQLKTAPIGIAMLEPYKAYQLFMAKYEELKASRALDRACAA